MKKHTILQDNLKVCFFTGRTDNIHTHEVFFGTANRQKSIEDGLVVALTAEKHNMSQTKDDVHHNKDLDLILKKYAQKVWMEKNNKSTYEFIERYGRNYL